MKLYLLFFTAICCLRFSYAQKTKGITVIAYYSNGPEKVAQLPAEKLTHIIFSFGHLKGNQFAIDSKRDSTTIRNLVLLKKRNPNLKVILSLGGWGGCETCSDVFLTAAGRHEFALSVAKANQYFKTDGIDLDWEYPAIEGYPGHTYKPEDRKNFTSLIKDLRSTLDEKSEISFAAGGFKKFIDEAVEWKEVLPIIDRVNVMTYDLVSGFSTKTGHHTSLYSTKDQAEATDRSIEYLIQSGIPSNKLVLGAAFYGRMWEEVPSVNNGLYQSGKFKDFINFKDFDQRFGANSGFTYFWDDQAKAPYLYNTKEKLFVTYDDKKSIALKTKYAIDHQLDGITFWELSCDKDKDGLLDEIVKTKKLEEKKKQ
jgi:chitinase